VRRIAKQRFAIAVLLFGLLLGVGQFSVAKEVSYGDFVDVRTLTGLYADCGDDFSASCGSCASPQTDPDWARHCARVSSRVEYGWPLSSPEIISTKTIINFAIFVVPTTSYAAIVFLDKQPRKNNKSEA
jgi:hypothetical protein